MTMIPTIHMNGDKKETLLDGYVAAIRAVRAAKEAIAAACPNGRNFYPQGDGAINQAVEEHRHRLATLNRVMDELEFIAEAIA
jgi:hypothetical protein